MEKSPVFSGSTGVYGYPIWIEPELSRRSQVKTLLVLGLPSLLCNPQMALSSLRLSLGRFSGKRSESSGSNRRGSLAAVLFQKRRYERKRLSVSNLARTKAAARLFKMQSQGVELSKKQELYLLLNEPTSSQNAARLSYFFWFIILLSCFCEMIETVWWGLGAVGRTLGGGEELRGWKGLRRLGG